MATADQARANALTERLDGFGYDYRMRCECDNSSRVSSDLYHAQSMIADGAAPCEHCGQRIAVTNENIALRDPDDPALSKDKVNDLAWYHTCTYAHWPWPGYGAMIADQYRESASIMPPSVFAQVLHRDQNKALHLGSYESAIENMHRRMHNQDDAHSQFYLHRVSLRLSPDDIADELRHESHDEASQLALEDLGGLMAVRYLNVEESPGSISLAIAPPAIDTIQTLPVPPALPAADPPAQMLAAVAQLEVELAEIDAEMPKLPDDEHTPLILLQARGDVRALRIGELQQRRWKARQRLELQLTDTYLAGVNPVVRQNFTDALAWPEPSGTAESFHDHFRGHAAALTRAADLVAELTRQAVRTT